MKKQYQTSRVLVCESALFRTTSTLLFLPEATIIVDPNWLPEEIEVIKTALASRSSLPLYLLFTHSDYDHIIGYGAFPEAKVIATQAFQENQEKDQTLQQIRDFDDAYYIQRNYPISYPEVDMVVQADGQTLDIGECRLRFYLSPGHNPDGMFTLVEPDGILLVGDYLSNVEFPYVYYSFKAYRQSLQKAAHLIREEKVNLLISGHGDCTTKVTEMEQRLSESLTYLDALEKSVRTQQPFDLDALWRRYDFPGVMSTFHEANLKLAQKEWTS